METFTTNNPRRCPNCLAIGIRRPSVDAVGQKWGEAHVYVDDRGREDLQCESHAASRGLTLREGR